MKTNFLNHALPLLALLPTAGLLAGQPDFQAPHLAVGFSRGAPAFSLFAVDSLGQGKLGRNPVLAETNAVAGLELHGQTYQRNGKPVWRVEWGAKALTLRSEGLLVDNHHALLAVLNDVKAKKP